MKTGVSVSETYEGPRLDAVEFRLYDGNMDTRASVLDALSRQFELVSAHLPSFLPSSDTPKEVAFDVDGRVHHFVAHVTRRAKPGGDWTSAWREYAACGRKILFENHNQDWHPTDAGLCVASEFQPIVDAGHSLCLDLGHILYSTMFKTQSDQQWREEAERVFDAFLPMPIEAVHVHTVDRHGGVDHRLSGFDIGPWLRRIAERHPDVILLVEVMDPAYSVEDRLDALRGWLRA